MTTAANCLNYLTIRHDGKGIPYPGMPAPRGDATQNFGFKNLKGAPEDVMLIPELREDAALRRLAAALAQPAVGLITIGCAKYPVVEGNESRLTGYVEFSLNSRTAIEDAGAYFPLFFHFDRLLHRAGFAAKAQFNWELQGVTFIHLNAVGFTCTVFVNTLFATTLQQAEAWWAEALGLLDQYLTTVPAFSDPLY